MKRSRDEDWSWDAPDPEEVLAHVETLFAQETRLGGSDERHSSDHEKLRKAADTYYTIFSQIVCESIPDSAYEVADVHKLFAEQVLRAEVPGARTTGWGHSQGLADLVRLAEACLGAVGPSCENCGLPKCLHAPPHAAAVQ